MSVLNASPTAIPTMSTTQLSVLLVDDDPALLRGLQRSLERLGYLVTSETSPRQALARWDAGERSDIVISDLSMPEMDGIEFLACIRRASPQVVRLGMSGFVDPGLTRQAQRTGDMHAFLAKPWTPDSLEDVLEYAADVAGASAVK